MAPCASLLYWPNRTRSNTVQKIVLLRSAGIAHDDSDSAVILVAFYAKTPENVVALGWVIDGSISLSIVTATSVAYFLAAAVVVRNEVVFPVSRVLASAAPGDW